MTVPRGNNRVGLGINKRNLQYDAVEYGSIFKKYTRFVPRFSSKSKIRGGNFSSSYKTSEKPPEVLYEVLYEVFTELFRRFFVYISGVRTRRLDFIFLGGWVANY